MDVKHIQDTLLAYHELAIKIKKAALDKVKAEAGTDKNGREPPWVRYLTFSDFYVDDDNTVNVAFTYDYDAPYSNAPEVILTPEEIAAL